MSDERRLVVRVEGFTGLEHVAYSKACAEGTPEALVTFAEHCARLCFKEGNPFAGRDPSEQILVLELPFGTFRVVHAEGAVVPYDKVAEV